MSIRIDSPFSLYELEVLKKYRKPRKVDPEDKKILEEYSLVGLVKWGYSPTKGYETAVLTSTAIPLLEFWEWRFKKSQER